MAPLEVGAIHGRLLTAWSAAGIAGPLIVNGFLDRSGSPGTLEASAYYPALVTMSVILAVGFVANLLLRPVHEKHFDQEQTARYQRRLQEDPSLATAKWSGGH